MKLNALLALALLVLGFFYVRGQRERAVAEFQRDAALAQADTERQVANALTEELQRLGVLADSLQRALDAEPPIPTLDIVFVTETITTIREVLPPQVAVRFDSLTTYWARRDSLQTRRIGLLEAGLVAMQAQLDLAARRDSVRLAEIAQLREALDAAPGPDGFFEDAGEILAGVGAGALLLTLLR